MNDQSTSSLEGKPESSEVEEEVKMKKKGSSSSSYMPSNVKSYLDPHYWDQRFSSEENYEWFKDYSHFQHIMRKHVKSTDTVLELGTGNSSLCVDLYSDGITNITCTDLSIVAVDKMKKRLLEEGIIDVRVLQADMLDMPFEADSFDVIVEKGTMDVLFVDTDDPWNPSSATTTRVMKMLRGVHRVLRPNGTFISVSFGQPHFRRKFFEASEFCWNFEWETFGDGFHYFLYALRKGERLSMPKSNEESFFRPSISLFHEELEDENYIFRTHVDE